MPIRDRWEPPPLATRLRNAAIVGALQNLLFRPVSLARAASSYLYPSASKPSLVKTYPSRPGLSVSIFFPPSHDPASPSPLPTLFTIHGGGFFAGSSADADHLSAQYTARHGLLVLSLTYHWAPSGPFPAPVHDVAALIRAALADASLPIDPARVSLLGWSAGANLALAAAQLPDLRDKIAAVVPVYPVVDWTPTAEDKLPTRQWKPSLGGFRARDRDLLMPMAPLSEWSYLPAGQDLRDPLLSPFFAPRAALPRNIFVVAAEMDLLAHEAWRIAWALAGREGKPGPQVGRAETAPAGELVLDDERFFFDEAGVRWLLVPDAVHGFDMDMARLMRDPVASEDGRLKGEKVVDMVGAWLKDLSRTG